MNGLLRALIIFMVSVLSACLRTDDSGLKDDGMTREIRIFLSVSRPTTRSVNDGGEVTESKKGNEFESAIKDLHLYTFSQSDGKLIISSYVDSDIIETYDSGITLAIPSYKWNVSQDIRIVAIANTVGFGINPGDLSSGISSYSDLQSINLSMPVDQNDIDRIPMYGEAILSNISKDEGVDIPMNRRLAKIEVAYSEDIHMSEVQLAKCQGAFKLVSEPVSNLYPYILGLSFRHDESDKLFYVYIPEMLLDDGAKGANRKISLIYDEGKKADIWLAPYENDATAPTDPDNSSDWQAIEGNHVYRFNVKREEVEEKIELEDNIVIRWDYYVVNGKFSSTDIPNLYLDNHKIKIEGCMIVEGYLWNDEYHSFQFDISSYKDRLIDIKYQLENDEGNPLSQEGYLLKDIIASPETVVINKTKYSILYLTKSETIARYLDRTNFKTMPNDLPYRFYFRNPDFHQIIIEDGNEDQAYLEYADYLVDEERGYKYVEFTIPNNLKVPSYLYSMFIFSARNKSGKKLNIDISKRGICVFDILVEEYKGVKRYVYYYD